MATGLVPPEETVGAADAQRAGLGVDRVGIDLPGAARRVARGGGHEDDSRW